MTPTIHLAPGKVLPQWLEQELFILLAQAGEPSCLVTSIARTPKEQAGAMLANIRKTSAEDQCSIYAQAGDEVIKVFHYIFWKHLVGY